MIYICVSLLFTCMFVPVQDSKYGEYHSFCSNSDSTELVRQKHSLQNMHKILRSMEKDTAVKCYSERGDSV